MAVEDTASVSEGEAVAALASSLSLSPRREPAGETAPTPAARAEGSDAGAPPTAGSLETRGVAEEGGNDGAAGAGFALLLRQADLAAMRRENREESGRADGGGVAPAAAAGATTE
ncbi:unnamed protein product, partial [Ectocarpus sp. 12 AP-2014]